MGQGDWPKMELLTLTENQTWSLPPDHKATKRESNGSTNMAVDLTSDLLKHNLIKILIKIVFRQG